MEAPMFDRVATYSFPKHQSFDHPATEVIVEATKL